MRFTLFCRYLRKFNVAFCRQLNQVPRTIESPVVHLKHSRKRKLSNEGDGDMFEKERQNRSTKRLKPSSCHVISNSNSEVYFSCWLFCRKQMLTIMCKQVFESSSHKQVSMFGFVLRMSVPSSFIF